jgi:PPOX class probable F420-dependent enzyme
MTDAPVLHQPPALTIADASDSHYLLLRTFRADGTGVDTPIWFAIDDRTLWFRTPTATAKVRRLRAHPAVELRLC